MPSDDDLWLDNRDSVQHRGKQAIEPDEQQTSATVSLGFEGTRWRSTFN